MSTSLEHAWEVIGEMEEEIKQHKDARYKAGQEMERMQAELALARENLKRQSVRIHNQRCQLRQDWVIFEERSKFRRTELNMMWLRKVLSQARAINELKAALEEIDRLKHKTVCNCELEAELREIYKDEAE